MCVHISESMTSLRAKEVRLTDESAGGKFSSICGDFVEKVNGQFVGDFEHSYVASGLCLIKMTLKPKLLF